MSDMTEKDVDLFSVLGPFIDLWWKSVGRYGRFIFLFLMMLDVHSLFSQECAFDLLRKTSDEQWIDQALSVTDHPEAADFVLPVVYHVIHDGSKGLLTQAQVENLHMQMNTAFENAGYFDQGTGADTEIQFCLAKRDPMGLPSIGVTWTESSLTDMVIEDDDLNLKSLSRWDPTCYINVYIVFEISSSVFGDRVGGYAYFPSVHGSNIDGIVIETKVAGGDPASASTLVHEMGHYLGLFHTFEGGCLNQDCQQQGDRICDTPPDNSTAPGNCSDPFNSCTTDAQSGLSSDLPDMMSNYMDYGYTLCRNDFTQGQGERMRLAITIPRRSLLNCASCTDPCPSPFQVSIEFDSLYTNIGAPYELGINGLPPGADIEWLLDGNSESSASTWNPDFLSEGEKKIILQVTSPDGLCKSSDTVCVDVQCGLRFTHDMRDTACLTPTSVLRFFANGDQGVNSFQWFIDGALFFEGTNFEWLVPAQGVYTLYLVAKGENCDQTTKEFALYVSCREICDNEIDDDGDGLIDGFDDDCCSEDFVFYYDPCDDFCEVEIKDAFDDIHQKYVTSGFRWNDGSSPLVGDFDNDGEVEILGTQTEVINGNQRVSRNYLILDGATGNLELEHQLTGNFRSFSQTLAVADVDRNGYAEIYTYSRELARYDFTPAGTLQLRWSLGGAAFVQPSITDIDEDGQVEIVIENGVFDAQTGRNLIQFNTSIHVGGIGWAASKSGSAVVDILPDDFCPNCSGKELVLGSQVYSVDINRGGISRLNLEVELTTPYDGYTSIADIDMDGDLDAVVINTEPLPDFRARRNLVVWDVQTPNTLYPVYSWSGRFERVAQASIGEVGGNNLPEIIIADNMTIRSLSVSPGGWIENFVGVNNDASGMTGSSLFDFDADGRFEVVISDQEEIRILDGISGQVLFSDECLSGTGQGTPVIADIDGDREAELLCSCIDQLQVYEPRTGRWAYTRPVWNQNIYYNVNVNDDLTIPRREQLHHIPQKSAHLNSYIAQYSYNELRAPDWSALKSTSTCQGEEVIYEVVICNEGYAQAADSVFVSFYSGDPRSTAANRVFSRKYGITELPVGECDTLVFTFSRDIGNVFAVINDNAVSGPPYSLEDDFVNKEELECGYENNIISLSAIPFLSPPDLGPDTSMCEFGTIILEAGSGYSSYRWPDGSDQNNFTVTQPGKYFVEVQDSCGFSYFDTINIIVDTARTIDLGGDRSICAGEELRFNFPGFNQLSWFPEDKVSCSDCNEITVKSDTSFTLSVAVFDDSGCSRFDSIRIEILPYQNSVDSFLICDGDSVLVNDIWYKEQGIFTDTIDNSSGCDTIIGIVVYQDLVSRLALPDTIFVKSGENYMVPIQGDTLQFGNPSWESDFELQCSNCFGVGGIGVTSGLLTLYYTQENGCTYSVTTYVMVEKEDEDDVINVYIPNTFSPNGDNLNDIIRIFTNDEEALIEDLMIFDRWGELLYVSRNTLVKDWIGWNGTFEGEAVPSGVYVMALKLRLSDGSPYVVGQDFTLLH